MIRLQSTVVRAVCQGWSLPSLTPHPYSKSQVLLGGPPQEDRKELTHTRARARTVDSSSFCMLRKPSPGLEICPRFLIGLAALSSTTFTVPGWASAAAQCAVDGDGAHSPWAWNRSCQITLKADLGQCGAHGTVIEER